LLLILVIFSYDLYAKGIPGDIYRKKSEKILKNAQNAIKNNEYQEAENLIYRAIRIDSGNVNLFLLLSDISDELGKPDQKKQALTKILSLDSVNYPLANKLLAEYYFKYGDYSNALDYFLRYSHFKISRDSLLTDERINSCRFAIGSLFKNRDVKITHLDSNVNSLSQEYWPAISTDDSLLYFTRLIKDGRQFPYERIFVSKKDDSGWGTAFRMNFSDNEDVNIGSMCISSDGKLLFFTACGRNDGKGSCDIYYSQKVNNSWSLPLNAGAIINTPFWEAQPSISSDNRKLFFASNRTGGLGNMDIWCSEIIKKSDGNLFFNVPSNLGRCVNSPEDDFSPFIHADGSTLYFSSKGRCGMGGSDLFMSKLIDSLWIDAVNLGFPINTRYNEDGLVVSPTARVVIFSSNREGSVGGSKDLYQFKLPAEFLPEKVGYIKGFVYDVITGSKLKSSVELTQLETNDSRIIICDQNEGYIATLVANRTYALNVNLDGYLFYSKHFNLNDTVGFNQAETVNIYLEPIQSGKKFVLSNIFFDFDSDRLKEESNAELIQLTDFLLKNSKLRVEISGHTDNTGSSDYNFKLSENRAKAIFDYLKKLINEKRMIYKGYGSNLPVASNDNEQGRAQNRRCEIMILSN
jgi:outer membrane protein OmpA-like peptidoglycan-associated protein/tetratricopeptide (TPR) repeat protein